MKITYNWLKDYIDFSETPAELAEKLTNAGFEVEEYYPLVQFFSGVVVGKVNHVEKHPNADKLSVCKVSDGNEEYQVICGAPNVRQGQVIPFAKIGAELAGGFKIKKAKIRGIESSGMICSKEELGLENKSDGIWAFDKITVEQLGSDVYNILNSNPDFVFDFFITPNRPDCLSLTGIAREVSAITGKSFTFPVDNLNESSKEIAKDVISVNIQDTEGCPRYAARVIKGITIGPSPQWMQDRLAAVGVRPINNIVDITNYVLMELGQPLHAFDLNEISGREINVRKSIKEETFITLDGKQRTLPENTVMICDKKRAVAIGGIMGGLNSEVSEKTTDVLLESAYFTPTRIAGSGKKLGLSSEASHRFERGSDPNGVIRAIDRASTLLQEIAGGTVLKGIVDIYPNEIKPRDVLFHPKKINRVLGSDLSDSVIKEKLRSIQLEVKDDVVTIPTFRVDLNLEVDLAEEVARLVNYSNLPTNNITDIDYGIPQSNLESKLNFIRTKLLELNLQEAFTSSMLKDSEATFFSNGQNIRILNPVSDDMTTMRPSILPGLLKAVSYNINRNTKDLQLFELGRIFTNYREGNIPEQPYSIAMVMTGTRFQDNWSTTTQTCDFYDIKGYLESFLSKIFLDNFHFILYDADSYFTKSQTMAIVFQGQNVGYFGKLDSTVCTAFGIDQAVYAFEINLELILDRLSFDRQYHPISKFPYSERDMSLVVDSSVTAQEIMGIIKKNGTELLQHIEVFDVFRGGSLGTGKKSVSFRMRFLSNERTLGDKEVDKIFRTIINQSEKNFSATLRN